MLRQVARINGAPVPSGILSLALSLQGSKRHGIRMLNSFLVLHLSSADLAGSSTHACISYLSLYDCIMSLAKGATVASCTLLIKYYS